MICNRTMCMHKLNEFNQEENEIDQQEAHPPNPFLTQPPPEIKQTDETENVFDQIFMTDGADGLTY